MHFQTGGLNIKKTDMYQNDTYMFLVPSAFFWKHWRCNLYERQGDQILKVCTWGDARTYAQFAAIV